MADIKRDPLRMPTNPRGSGTWIWRRLGLGWTACLILTGLVAAQKTSLNQPAGSQPPTPVRDDVSAEQVRGRLREGTEVVDQLGHFETANQRLVFVADRGKVPMVGLENLNLERVARAVSGYPGQLRWRVSGTVTEYRGVNYLLVRRAVVTTSLPGGSH